MGLADRSLVGLHQLQKAHHLSPAWLPVRTSSMPACQAMFTDLQGIMQGLAIYLTVVPMAAGLLYRLLESANTLLV